MKTALLIFGILAVLGIGIFVIIGMMGGKKKKQVPPPPILPKQYHDRYPKRSGFLEKGMLTEEEQPTNSSTNSSSEKHEN